jgi:hypothetical protein
MGWLALRFHRLISPVRCMISYALSSGFWPEEHGLIWDDDLGELENSQNSTSASSKLRRLVKSRHRWSLNRRHSRYWAFAITTPMYLSAPP